MPQGAAQHIHSHLPPELWIDILRSTVDVPDSFEYPQILVEGLQSNCVGIGDRVVPSKRATERFKASLTMKARLVCVCRQWYTWTISWLYEHVRVEESGHLELLLEVVARPVVIRDADDTRKLGDFVKRLDLVAPMLRWIQVQTSPPLYSPAPRLCKLCPNLATLVSTCDRDSGEAIPFSDVISPQLESVCFIGLVRLATPEWIAFMDSHPCLSFVYPPYLKETIENGGEGWKGKRWPSIREIVCTTSTQARIYVSQFEPGSFPGLQKLAFLFTPPKMFHLEALLSAHGRNLISIHFKPPPFDFDLALSLAASMGFHCPHLQELIVSFSLINILEDIDPTISPGIPSLPAITVLGVRYVTDAVDHAGGPQTMAKFCSHALAWVKVFAGTLEKVWLFDEENVICLQESNDQEGMLDEFLKDCTSLSPVQVLDHFHRRLN